MPKVTIIIPSYNHNAFLIDRLETIVSQTYKDWEAIVIDDKSTDNSVAIIEKFIEKNPSFKVKHFIINTQNSGSGYTSWEKGIELAETDYIWIAETDDYSEPTFLEEQISVLEQNKNAALSFCVSNYVEDGKIRYDSTKRTKDLNVIDGENKVFNGKVFIDRMPFNTYITNGSAVVFRKPLNPIPKAIFNNRQTSDLFFWTFLLQNADFIFLNKALNYFRRHSDSTTTKMNLVEQKNIYIEKIKYLNFFNQTHKFPLFLKHYFENYVWQNKRKVSDTKFLNNLENVPQIKTKYYFYLVKFFIHKMMKRVWI
ncbi:glycosyltransferase [Flavobacterium sp.]|uniref:glycosyltransferase family 2 protein n=1 Tax=Flavobacterium sp. TaxID=239 RepID=UPI00286DCFFA|nr:glycosyltransferase [Flavobacterium sp.]